MVTPENRLTAVTLVLASIASTAQSQAPAPELVRLWAKGAPGFESRQDEPEQSQDYWVKNIHNPSLTAFLPEPSRATGAAVVVCPGGGHRELVFHAEGEQACLFLRDHGVAAFALKYRLGREEGSPYDLHVHPREDALRAMRLVRSRAAEWRIDPSRAGMLGFSAGGEVASMTAFGDNGAQPDAADPIDRQSGRPDFLVYVYPGPLGLPGAVPADAPPALLVCAVDDRGAMVGVGQLLDGYRKSGAPYAAHLFPRGGHAFNMGDRSDLRSIRGWPDRMADWLSDSGFLSPAAAR